MSAMHAIMDAIGLASLFAAAGYAVLALTAMLIWRLQNRTKVPVRLPP